MKIKSALYILISLSLMLTPYKLYASAFGIGIGHAKITSDGTSNLEDVMPNIKTKTDSEGISYNLQIHQGITDSIFFEIGMAQLSYITKDQTDNNISSGNITAFRAYSKEDYSALYGAIGLAQFVSDQFAIYGSLGASIKTSVYEVKIVKTNSSNVVDVENGKEESRKLGYYLSVGVLYNLTNNLMVKASIDDFGVMGKGTEIKNIYFTGRADSPESAGSRVQRAIVNILFRY